MSSFSVRPPFVFFLLMSFSCEPLLLMKRIQFIAIVVDRSGYFVSPGRTRFSPNEQINVTETKCLL